MEQRLDYYTLIGFAPETEAPEDLGTLAVPAHDTALFLDFDGTLVDIAETPSAVTVSARDGLLLDQLGRRHANAVAIISGRNLHEIEKFLQDFSGTISGGHGAELRHAGEHFPGIDCDFERLEHIKNAVMEFAIIDPRVIAEDKSFGIVLHFRQHPELESKVHDFLACLVNEEDGFELQSAKMAFEIKPKGISKAKAIERIMQFEEFAGRTILFAGDDETDETAFGWVNAHGGLSVKIGDGPTIAQYRTASPTTLKKWLRSQPDASRREA
ncbi:hypothetical protein LL06_07525 [Hoeflea sp. BAL378]|nr:hypothetical protein LL06_07525 [Hoeflea sp. BAL378]